MTQPNSFPAGSRRSRATAKLKSILDRHLQSYALAAEGTVHRNKQAMAASALSLAGAALLTTLPAAGEVVYSPADIHVNRSRTGVTFVPLDINNDGQPDFKFAAAFGADFSSGNDIVYRGMRVYGYGPSNQAMSSRGRNGAKAALPIGARVGPAGKFGAHSLMATCDDFNGRLVYSGAWINAENRYLGVKFQINGETHYGWVRMTVNCNDGTITGYAYETVANRPIDAGILPFANQSDASPAEPKRQPATLGILAAGTLGLPRLRQH